MPRGNIPTQLQPESFRNILKLEATKGYGDSAVMGGMDRFLARQASDISAMAGEARDLLIESYSTLELSRREEWVARWLARLGGDAPPRQAAAPGETRAEPTCEQPGGADQAAQGLSGTSLAGVSTGPPRPDARLGLSLDIPVDRLRGVDVKLSAKLRRLGVSTIRDLLYLFPRRHNDFARLAKVCDLVPGEEQTIVGTVWEATETGLRRGKLRTTEAVVGDETGNVRIVWFGQPYLAKVLKPNSRVTISGRVDVYRGHPQFQSPEFEMLDRQEGLIHTGRLVPVYPLTAGLTPRRLRGIVWQALEEWSPLVEEFLPDEVRSRARLAPLPLAIAQAHYPDDPSSLEAARRRLAFDELFLLQMAVLIRRKSWQDETDGIRVQPDPKVLEGFIASLPFDLTAAQRRCINELMVDMERGTPPMNRILQGEVGSGKTVVALAALLAAVASGYQGSIMVPTEVLAEQHFGTVSRLLGDLSRPQQEQDMFTVYLDPLARPVSVALLTGSTKAAARRELHRRAAEGTLDITIGTHALIQEGVEMPRLALAVVDEQHRFGVMQRAALRRKGSVAPHVLVMSATPIPRTLALTLYGDLDISTIDELPPGRQRIRTRYVPPDRREAAYEFVRKEIKSGRQAFVICPLVEESEAVEARAATEEHERISSDVFPELRLGLLHGRMAARDKEDVMRRFRDGEIDVLVSTAVVEVGIDVPNASVMLVEGAHRFGLSQLHQFRGRVGRGEHQSYCLLLSEYSTTEAKERLSAVGTHP